MASGLLSLVYLVMLGMFATAKVPDARSGTEAPHQYANIRHIRLQYKTIFPRSQMGPWKYGLILHVLLE